ncbi:hypothetical protein JHK87_039549 [Glycine soja]|nr:hypothetical protein JHK87_039549 [Glycine soja]
MVNPDWRILFPQALVEVLYQHNSDHNPLLLSCSKLVVDAWLSRPEYPNLVVDAWQGRTLQVPKLRLIIEDNAKLKINVTYVNIVHKLIRALSEH